MAPQYVNKLIDNPFSAFLAACVLLWFARPIFNFIRLEWRSSSLPRYNHGPNPAWALVTGASDGIGYGFACQLASQGFNVVLHGRNRSKIEGLIKDLRVRFPPQSFRALIVDASDRSAWHKLDEFAEALSQEDINLTVLINNVGTGVHQSKFVFKSTESTPSDEINALLDTNAAFPLQITRAMLPLLKQNQPSLVINMGSAAGTMVMPYLATYCATKAFNAAWSTSLRMEMLMHKYDIEVFSVFCLKVQSAGTKMVPTNMFVPSSATFARSTLQKVGSGYDSVIGYWGHAIQYGLVAILPSFVWETLALSITRDEMALERKAA